MKTLNLYVATQKGIFILTTNEDRKEWNIEGPILKGWQVFHVAADERGARKTLYSAVGNYVYGATIMRSTNMGRDWKQIENGPAYAEDSESTLKDIWYITPGHLSEPETLFAGVSEAGIFVSRDGGDSWTEMKGLSEHATRGEWVGGLGGLCCHTIQIDPGNPGRMWVAISAVGVFRSEDGGETWQVKNEGLEIVIPGKEHKQIGSCVHKLVMDRKKPDRLFQQNHRGVFRSLDAGDSWQRIEAGLPGTFGFPMVMHPQNSDWLYTVPQESDEFRFAKDGKLTVYRSKDAGTSWQPMRKGLPNNSFVGVLRGAMATDSIAEQAGIYFGTTGGQIFYSRDDGDNWELLPFLLPRISSLATVIE
ncbi:MAG: WD40/YVTN/BNR-like repeat-containing protein [Calditrichia bacterium]